MQQNTGLWHSFQEGGWGMYPILALGLVGLFSAARFAWRGERSLVGALRWLVFALVSCGVFGFVIGMIRASHFVAALSAPEQRGAVLVEGLGEALNNVAMALLFAVLIGLLVALGKRRFPALDAAR